MDLDTCQGLARKYQITSVPTFVFRKGRKIERVQGFSPDFKAALDKLKDKAALDSEVEDRNSQTSSDSSNLYVKEIQQFLPKGFEVVNDAIHFGEMVALNVMPLYKENTEVKLVFKPLVLDSTIYTDADSQALFFVPFNHICKVYSILIKILKPEALELKELELDLEELKEEAQLPSLVKVWANKPAVLSFEDCTASDALHEEKLQPNLQPGWHEIKLRYVRFQNVQNLNIFVDGADEDSHTIIEKVVIVGLTGESTEHISIQQDEE